MLEKVPNLFFHVSCEYLRSFQEIEGIPLGLSGSNGEFQGSLGILIEFQGISANLGKGVQSDFKMFRGDSGLFQMVFEASQRRFQGV